MHLAVCAENRDNHFNLLRALAASAVFVAHGVGYAGGSEALGLRAGIGEALGRTAVEVFFAISGFLVTASLVERGSVAEYARARVRRIYPALWVLIPLSVLVAGPLLTELSVGAYLRDGATWRYLLQGLTLVAGVAQELPGVFAQSVYPSTFNGPLWTLPIELWLYIALAVLWLAARGLAPRAPRAFAYGVLGVALATGAWVLAAQGGWLPLHRGARLVFLFFTGAACYVFRARIRLSAAVALGLVGVLGGLALVSPVLFRAGYLCSVVYLVLCLAYLPGGPLLAFNRLGDYSYGIYIYAFPLQQATALLLPTAPLGLLLAVSAGATLLCAVASWHGVEKRALATLPRRGVARR